MVAPADCLKIIRSTVYFLDNLLPPGHEALADSVYCRTFAAEINHEPYEDYHQKLYVHVPQVCVGEPAESAGAEPGLRLVLCHHDAGQLRPGLQQEFYGAREAVPLDDELRPWHGGLWCDAAPPAGGTVGGSVAAYQRLWHRRGLDKIRPVLGGRSGVFAESGVWHSRLYERIQANRHLW